MIIDSSALMAILFGEPEGEAFVKVLADEAQCKMSAATLLESSMVIESRKGDIGVEALDALIRQAKVEIVSFTAEQADYARRCFHRYGRGNHPAGLNFGDCISYALAMETCEPLLYKGEDFDKTDVEKVDWKSCAHKDN